jgi:hypothetical protein
LREETEDRFQLELEVRHDLVERFCQMSERKAGGPQPPPPARVTEANSSSLQVAPKQVCCTQLVLSLSFGSLRVSWLHVFKVFAKKKRHDVELSVLLFS